MGFIELNNVTKGATDFYMPSFSLTISQHERIAIAGETGSGKSTLLKLIGGFINPDTGSIHFNNERIKKVPDEKLLAGHPGIAYLSQYFELPNFLRVGQVLEYSNQLEDDEARQLYQLCNVQHLLNRTTSELSGGEKQRIALAKALGTRPLLLLLDEPYSNLDFNHKQELKIALNNVIERLGISCILVSHDPLDTLSWASRIIIMRSGEIIADDRPPNIYFEPINEYCAGLFGKYTALSNELMRAFSVFAHGKPVPPFIRPGMVQISIDPNTGITGRVVGKHFFGSFHELEVAIANSIIFVHVLNDHFQIGDRVQISLKPY